MSQGRSARKSPPPQPAHRTTPCSYLNVTQRLAEFIAMDSASPRVTLFSRMKGLLPSRFRFFLPGARRTAIAQSTIAPLTRYPTVSTARPEVTQHNAQSYYELAQRLQRLAPPDSIWHGPGSVQIVDTAPFASGGSSDVWKGTFQNRPVAVKSLRCYSSPDFDPAEVGIVSLSRSLRSNNH
jgi:hypothetical protein